MATTPLGPNYFIIGAPKCGTTALSEYLRTHPSVFMTEPKEPNFFNPDFDFYRAGAPRSHEAYLELYREATPAHRARGEASVWYLHSKVSAERIHARHPEAKLIAMVRDPLELVQSLHAQLVYMHDETVEDFERAWRLQADRREGRLLPTSVRQPEFLQYAEVATVSTQLERFLRSFARDQLLVIVFDDFRRDARACYRRVLRHLGVEDDDRSDFTPINESKIHRWRWLARQTQRPPAFALAGAARVKAMLGIERLRILPRIRQVNREERKRDPIRPELVDAIRREFEPEVRALSELIGRDLTPWSRGEPIPPAE